MSAQPKWWTTSDGDSSGPYKVYWLEDGCVESRKFQDEDAAAEWGNENLGERVNSRKEAV